jgi:hypothetical protein
MTFNEIKATKLKNKLLDAAITVVLFGMIATSVIAATQIGN